MSCLFEKTWLTFDPLLVHFADAQGLPRFRLCHELKYKTNCDSIYGRKLSLSNRDFCNEVMEPLPARVTSSHNVLFIRKWFKRKKCSTVQKMKKV